MATETLPQKETIDEGLDKKIQRDLESLHSLLSGKGLTEVYRISGPIIRFVYAHAEEDEDKIMSHINKSLGAYGLEAMLIPGGTSIDLFPKNGPAREFLTLYRSKYTDADENLHGRKNGKIKRGYLNQ